MPTAALRDNQIAFECTFVAHSLLVLPNTYPAYKDSAFDSVKTLHVALYLIQSMPLIVMLSYFEQHTGSNAHRYASHKQLPDVPELLHELLRSVLKVFVFIIVIWKSAAICLQKMHEMRCKCSLVSVDKICSLLCWIRRKHIKICVKCTHCWKCSLGLSVNVTDKLHSCQRKIFCEMNSCFPLEHCKKKPVCVLQATSSSAVIYFNFQDARFIWSFALKNKSCFREES